uniref:hypothetical protein n=1 Tax=Shewanella sp. 8A TaxID=2943323 RepID=UPI00201B3360
VPAIVDCPYLNHFNFGQVVGKHKVHYVIDLYWVAGFIEKRLGDKGWKTISGGSLPEEKVGNRYPDLVMKKGDDQIAVQVGRGTRGGIPVIRERRAMDDLRKTGEFSHVFFVRYDN